MLFHSANTYSITEVTCATLIEELARDGVEEPMTPQNDTTLCQYSEARGVAVRASWSMSNSFQPPRFSTSRNLDKPQVVSNCLPVLAKCENRDKYNAHRHVDLTKST